MPDCQGVVGGLLVEALSECTSKGVRTRMLSSSLNSRHRSIGMSAAKKQKSEGKVGAPRLPATPLPTPLSPGASPQCPPPTSQGATRSCSFFFPYRLKLKETTLVLS